MNIMGNLKALNKITYVLLIGMGISLAVWGCKENPVESLNLKKEHAGRGLIDLQTTAITHNTVTVKVTASSDGGAELTERGFVLSEEPNPNIQDRVITVSGNTVGSYSGTITGLWGSTSYFVKAYVKNTNGIFYGEGIEVITKEPIPATVKTGLPFEISAFSAKVTLQIPDNGGRPILEKGIAIGTSPDPTVSTSIAEKERIEIQFDENQNLSNTPNRTVTDENITQKETTDSEPELVLQQSSSTKKESEKPTLTDETEEVVELKNLVLATVYYIRAYVKTELGTSYGDEKQFTTCDGRPILTTVAISKILAKSAESGGTSIIDSGFPITQKGIVWGTSENPALANNKTEHGTGSELFTSPLTNLNPNTTYFVRAYATNSVGTEFGNELSFKTKDGVILLSSTTSATDITETSAVSGGNVTSDGGSMVIARGIVWSTTQNPTNSNRLGQTNNGNGMGSFTSNLTGLANTTTYYVRSYATNSVGTFYGTQIDFITLTPPPKQGSIYTNSISMEFVYIEPGSFYMGSTVGDSDEKPVHQVTITQGFYMGKYEVTQKQWVEIMGSNPSNFKGDNRPVETVSWNDIQTFISKLNEKEGGTKYRLPTEAEWEYCAQAGTAKNGEGPKWHFGNIESSLVNYAWYSSNSGGQTKDVGQKKPNKYGLYDVHGNVWEWVQDWYDSNYYSSSPKTDSKGPSSGSYRVSRGGSWDDDAEYTRSANRGSIIPEGRFSNLGFRLVRLQ